jgi:hypothetical protein
MVSIWANELGEMTADDFLEGILISYRNIKLFNNELNNQIQPTPKSGAAD